MKLKSTQGQSTYSVSISLIGKTTDFLSNYLLSMPLQFVIMTYFSSSVAYINGIQVAYYMPKYQAVSSPQDVAFKDVASDDLDKTKHSKPLRNNDNAIVTFRDTPENNSLSEQSTSNINITDESVCIDDQQCLVNSQDVGNEARCPRFCGRGLTRECIRFSAILCLGIILCLYAVGVVWNTQTVGGLLCPAAIAIVMTFAYSFLRYKSFSPNARFMAYL